MSESPATPPPGWYPDPTPDGEGRERRWDGSAWTQDVRDLAPEPPEQETEGDSGVLEVKGYGAIVVFDGQSITIRRRRLGRITVGKGEKHIPLRSVTAVQFKKAGPVVNGYIQFTVPGGNESRSGFGTQTFDAVKDENSVIFTYSQRKAFEELRDIIKQAIADYGTAQATPATPAPSAPDIPEQIKRLSELRDAGVLTEDEFTAKKADLLSRM